MGTTLGFGESVGWAKGPAPVRPSAPIVAVSVSKLSRSAGVLRPGTRVLSFVAAGKGFMAWAVRWPCQVAVMTRLTLWPPKPNALVMAAVAGHEVDFFGMLSPMAGSGCS